MAVLPASRAIYSVAELLVSDKVTDVLHCCRHFCHCRNVRSMVRCRIVRHTLQVVRCWPHYSSVVVEAVVTSQCQLRHKCTVGPDVDQHSSVSRRFSSTGPAADTSGAVCRTSKVAQGSAIAAVCGWVALLHSSKQDRSWYGNPELSNLSAMGGPDWFHPWGGGLLCNIGRCQDDVWMWTLIM